jgi:hypothetical protein
VGTEGPGKKPQAFRGSGLLSDNHVKPRKTASFLVAYKVSEIIRSDKDDSFDIMNEENLPLVHFLYLICAKATPSPLPQVRAAVAKAKLIKPQRGGG